MERVRITAEEEVWPVAGAFTIARGARTEARVIVVEAAAGGHVGRAECIPYARYGETTLSVLAAIRALPAELDHHALAAILPAGAARNGVDCALWDLAAKRSGQPVHALLGLPHPRALPTCFTLSLDHPDGMAREAVRASDFTMLKVKLGGGSDDGERMRAVRAARPDAQLLADANESWRPRDLEALLDIAAENSFTVVEQPLPSGEDAALARVARPVVVCADESAHTSSDLARLLDRYDAVNIKLDKTGGLTEALAMRREARRLGLKVMVGCMLSTSLAMAPALIVAQDADWIDLDGPLLLARDRADGLTYENGHVQPADRRLWG